MFMNSDDDDDTVSGRSIVWLQNKRDATLERLRGPSPRREDAHEFRVGRLKHERICVPRDDSLLEWAMQVMKYHGDRKAVLEVSHLLISVPSLGVYYCQQLTLSVCLFVTNFKLLLFCFSVESSHFLAISSP